MTLGERERTELLAAARHAGARAAEVLLEERRGFRAACEGGRVGVREPFEIQAVELRIWLEDGRRGVARGNPSTVARLPRRAVRAAEKAMPDPSAGPTERVPIVTRGLGIDDRRHEALGPSERVDVLVGAEKAACATDRRLRSRGFTYEDQRVHRVLANTRGMVAEEWSTRYRLVGALAVGDGAAATTGSEALSGRSFADVATLPFAVTLARRLVELHDAPRATPEPDVRLLLPPRLCGRLVARIGDGFATASVRPGAFFLTRRPVTVSPKLHLIDDGALQGGIRTRAFDDRGSPPLPVVLIREGEPSGRYETLESARRGDRLPTGHVRGASLAPSNLVLRGGTRSINALLADGVPTLVLQEAEGLDTFDLRTGKLALRASGFLHRASRVEGAVRHVPIRGELLEALREVIDLASDTERVEHVDAPGVMLRGLVVG